MGWGWGGGIPVDMMHATVPLRSLAGYFTQETPDNSSPLNFTRQYAIFLPDKRQGIHSSMKTEHFSHSAKKNYYTLQIMELTG
jgi:hypothetical protein